MGLFVCIANELTVFLQTFGDGYDSIRVYESKERKELRMKAYVIGGFRNAVNGGEYGK